MGSSVFVNQASQREKCKFSPAPRLSHMKLLHYVQKSCPCPCPSSLSCANTSSLLAQEFIGRHTENNLCLPSQTFCVCTDEFLAPVILLSDDTSHPGSQSYARGRLPLPEEAARLRDSYYELDSIQLNKPRPNLIKNDAFFCSTAQWLLDCLMCDSLFSPVSFLRNDFSTCPTLYCFGLVRPKPRNLGRHEDNTKPTRGLHEAFLPPSSVPSQPMVSDTASVEAAFADFTCKLDALESALRPVLAAVNEVRSGGAGEALPPLMQARVDATLAYALNAMFCMYLRTQGQDPTSHPVRDEMERVRAAYVRIHRLEAAEKGRPRKRKHAAVHEAEAELVRVLSDGEHALLQAVDGRAGDSPQEKGGRRKTFSDDSDDGSDGSDASGHADEEGLGAANAANGVANSEGEAGEEDVEMAGTDSHVKGKKKKSKKTKEEKEARRKQKQKKRKLETDGDEAESIEAPANETRDKKSKSKSKSKSRSKSKSKSKNKSTAKGEKSGKSEAVK